MGHSLARTFFSSSPTVLGDLARGREAGRPLLGPYSVCRRVRGRRSRLDPTRGLGDVVSH